VKGKEHRELAKLEKHREELHDTLWKDGVAMLGSHPESGKPSAEKTDVRCKNTALQILFGFKISRTKVTSEGRRKGSLLLGMACQS